MKRICAWCRKEMGEVAPEQPGITHGICEECREKVLAERDGQSAPVGPHTVFLDVSKCRI